MSQELPKLQRNKSLRELDLRLNPVSQRGGMHYRLTLVHLVPGLRRLDDVDVKDTERSQCGFLKTCLGYKFPFITFMMHILKRFIVMILQAPHSSTSQQTRPTR